MLQSLSLCTFPLYVACNGGHKTQRIRVTLRYAFTFLQVSFSVVLACFACHNLHHVGHAYSWEETQCQGSELSHCLGIFFCVGAVFFSAEQSVNSFS